MKVIVLVLISICSKKKNDDCSVGAFQFIFISDSIMYVSLRSYILIILPISSHEILKYTIEEKSPINTLIADLSRDLNIKSPRSYQIYELLPLNKNLFSINNQTGHLTLQINY